MAFIHFDSSYAPCAFLIVPDGGDPYDDKQTTLIQTDWDYPGIATSMGWTACQCGRTDGTVDCVKCKRKVGTMISEAYDFIQEREGESFAALDDYLPSARNWREFWPTWELM